MSESAPRLEYDFAEEELIGRSPAMLTVFKLIGRVAATSEPVLVTGESGTGKELVANAIHRSSSRADRPFIKVNSAALSSSLLESELFGHEKGAFTGAVVQRTGRFEQANGGTLFLDEIGDMDIDLQAKLLRVLQLGQFERVGGNVTIQTDVRVISATHRDLPARIAAGTFREDLFYRLNVVSIELPLLRQRPEDIPLMIDHFLHRLGQKYGWPQLAVAPEAMRHFVEMPWPGNVRELQNTISRAAILSSGRVIQMEHLTALPSTSPVPPPLPSTSLNLRDILSETERRVIKQALDQESWNRTRTAKVLGISRRQLFDKMQQYELRD
jgi:DNA-binding NtrC family response regulator